jgi:hypothetical protein
MAIQAAESLLARSASRRSSVRPLVGWLVGRLVGDRNSKWETESCSDVEGRTEQCSMWVSPRQLRTNIVQDEKGDMVRDCHSILVRRRNHFS